MLQLLHPLLQIRFLPHEPREAVLRPEQRGQGRAARPPPPPPAPGQARGDWLTCSLSMAACRVRWVSPGTLPSPLPGAGASSSGEGGPGAARRARRRQRSFCSFSCWRSLARSSSALAKAELKYATCGQDVRVCSRGVLQVGRGAEGSSSSPGLSRHACGSRMVQWLTTGSQG